MNLRNILCGCVAACLFLVGCGDSKEASTGTPAATETKAPTAEKTVAGEWEGKDDNGLPMTMTFGDDGKLTVDVKNPDGNVIMEGTYTVAGDDLTLNMTSARIENVPEEKAMLKDELNRQLNSGMPQKASLQLKWNSNDDLELQSNGKTTNSLKRKG